jgi:hypothetical protein
MMVNGRGWSSSVVAIALLTVLAVPLRAQVGVARLEGRPQFHEGKALGYFVWKDGDTWKVRWTTFGAEHRFSGRVVIEGGEIRSFKRIDVDEERKVLAPGRAPRVVRGPRGRVRRVEPGRPAVVATRDEDRIEQETETLIRFNTVTNDDLDGLEFKVTEATSAVRFFLEIDGKPRPAEVEVGRTNHKPGANPLIVRVR